MLRLGWRACTPLLSVGRREGFAKKVPGLSQGPQYSGVTVSAKLKAYPRSYESKNSQTDHRRLSGFRRNAHLISLCSARQQFTSSFGETFQIPESSFCHQLNRIAQP
jgi:hypothetical protein